MNNEDRDRVDKALANERNRPVSPNTLWQLEEERRLRDNELQERIRDYTNKLLVRRLHKSQTNPKMDRIQAVKDLKELRKIEKELEQRRTELQVKFYFHFRFIFLFKQKYIILLAQYTFRTWGFHLQRNS
jgi:lipopolysaccharide export LptBFGC system permease protein LptF